MKYSGVIFDFNGTLFWDSEKHRDAWFEMSKRLRGKPFTEEEMFLYMYGRTNTEIMKYAIGREPTVKEAEKCSFEKESIYLELCKKDAENTVFADGVKEFLDILVANNIPHTIATMSEKMNVDFYIKAFKLEKWFDLSKIVYSDGTIPGKPAPDIYIKAAKLLGLNPEDCIVFEDSLSGIESARKAGIGKITAVASKEPKEAYIGVAGVSEIITTFNNIIEKCQLNITNPNNS